MSRVFVAEETALHRKIVIKVLPPETAAQVSLERFKREILLAAKLQHPHIVPLLTAGVANGLPYFTMPFVACEDGVRAGRPDRKRLHAAWRPGVGDPVVGEGRRVERRWNQFHARRLTLCSHSVRSPHPGHH